MRLKQQRSDDDEHRRKAMSLAGNCMIDHALADAARGWFVFPAPSNGEKMGCTSAEKTNGNRWGSTKDPDEIRAYFAKFPRANVGIATGKDSDIFVVEVDTPEGHDVDGIASLRAL
jgi:Bifunctional DNA primase/polymerase, N-terminal